MIALTQKAPNCNTFGGTKQRQLLCCDHEVFFKYWNKLLVNYAFRLNSRMKSPSTISLVQDYEHITASLYAENFHEMVMSQ